MGLQRHIEENYERIVAAGTRTYKQIADQADKDGAPAVAAWARERAAAAGKDVTPHDQTAATLTYAEMSVKDLTALAVERSIDKKSAWTKQDYVDALEAADNAADTTSADEGSYAEYSDADIDGLLELRELTPEDGDDRAAKIARLQAADEAEANPAK